MHRSSVPKILQNTIYEISNNRENFNENPNMRAIVKILRAQTSEQLNFASKSSKGLKHLKISRDNLILLKYNYGELKIHCYGYFGREGLG